MSAKKSTGLLPIESMPRIPGLGTPDHFYLVTCLPAPLAGMSQPTVYTPWDALYAIGLQRIVCLTQESPDYDADPLVLSAHFPLQDLFRGLTPDNPISEIGLIYQATEKVLTYLKEGIGVIVHCFGGTGRTGTVLGCTLKALGYNSDTILTYLDQLNRVRGARQGWPESKWQADLIKKYPEAE